MHTCWTPRTVARTSTNEAVLARSMRSWVRNAPRPDWRRRSKSAKRRGEGSLPFDHDLGELVGKAFQFEVVRQHLMRLERRAPRARGKPDGADLDHEHPGVQIAEGKPSG